MHSSRKVSKMASTMGGMRRILKKPISVERYLRMAVETKVYRSADGPPEKRSPRRTGPTGATIQDYPIEYQILKMNPPIPQPPKVPKALRRLQEKQSKLPTDKFVKDYIERQAGQEVQNTEDNLTTEQYYERLLGIPPPPPNSGMGQKSSLLNKAYAFAVKQHQMIRENDLSEEESLAMVEELLQQEHAQERKTSRQTTQNVEEWRRSSRKQPDKDATTKQGPTATASSSSEAQDSTSIPSVMHGKTRAIQGLAVWSKRLQAVPYKEWTVGAMVALDHWIARSVLELSEETWNALLDGDTDSDQSLLSRGRDIVSVRRALFPETVDWEGIEEEEALASAVDAASESLDDESSSPSSSVDKSIDELLASLGSFDSRDGDSGETAAASFWKEDRNKGDDMDGQVDRLVDELQEWRRKHMKRPYEEWNTDQQGELKAWVKQYVETLTTDADGDVNLEETRKALLASPPREREEADEFWNQVRDETEAEILLDSLRQAGPPSATSSDSSEQTIARQVYSTFMHLPYELQLQKLVDLGTLRPVVDEFTSESNRVKFLARHGDKLLDGLELEHLVPDKEGPISGEDVGSWGEELGIKKNDRFRLEFMRYGTNEFGTARSERARALYRAWNTQKAGRARYEEALFKHGKLGLKYKE